MKVRMPKPMHLSLLRSKLSYRMVAYLLIGIGLVSFIGASGMFNGGVSAVLWPLLMIGVGLDLVTEGRHRRRVLAGTLLAALVVVPVVGMADLFGSEDAYGGRPEFTDAVPLPEGMRRLQVDISGVDGELSIRDKTGDRDQAVDLGRDDVSKTFDLDGDTGVLTIFGSGDEDLSLRFDRELPLDLTINSGAESASLDFEDLQLERLNLNVGNGDAQIKLPAVGVIDATIASELGGSVDLQIPDDLPARIEVDASASKLDIDEERFHKDGNAYVSKNYSDEEANRALIYINATIGNVKVH